MKTKIQYIKLCCLVGCLSLILSCSDTTSMDPVPGQESVRVALSPGVRAGYSVGTLTYGVYIFQSPEGENNFTLFNTLSPFASGTELEMSPSDLAGSAYRFFFIALPEGVSEQTVITEYAGAGGSVPATGLSLGCAWDVIRFNYPAGGLDADYYYGVTEMSGQEILDAGEVNGTLDRVVGQMVYDIFKTNGTVNDPVGVSSTADVASVLDRVYQIDIDYTGVTSRLLFEGTELVPDLEAAPIVYSEEIDAEELGLDLITGKIMPGAPSSGAMVESYLPEGAEASLYTGAVRIRGAYLLPATSGVTVSLTFHYYDTIPVCNNSSPGDRPVTDKSGKTIVDYTHESMEVCFPKKSISLNLPKSGTLGIQSNYFTANKAGIPCNRVIEVPVNKGIFIDTAWEN